MNIAEEITKREAELQQLKAQYAQQKTVNHAREYVLPETVGDLRSFVNEVRLKGHLNTSEPPFTPVVADLLSTTIPDLWADTLASTLTIGAFYGLWEFVGAHKEMGFDLGISKLSDFDLSQLEDTEHPLFRACGAHIRAGKVMSLMQRANSHIGKSIAFAVLNDNKDAYYANVRKAASLTEALQGIHIKDVTRGILTWDDVREYDEVLLPEAVHRDLLESRDSVMRLVEWFETRFKRFDQTYP